MQTALPNLKNPMNFPNQHIAAAIAAADFYPPPPPCLYSTVDWRLNNCQTCRRTSQQTLAANPAEPPAESTSISPEKASKIVNIANKLPNKKR